MAGADMARRVSLDRPLYEESGLLSSLSKEIETAKQEYTRGACRVPVHRVLLSAATPAKELSLNFDFRYHRYTLEFFPSIATGF